MNKIEELEESVERIERSRRHEVVSIDNSVSTTLLFTASSSTVDIEVDVASTALPHIELVVNGESKVYDASFVSEKVVTKKTNTLRVNIGAGGLISKRIRIEGIGVKLLSV